MAAAAFAAGFTDFGFSGHTYVPAENFGVKDEAAFVAAVRALAKQYEGKMHIYAAMEHDYYFPVQNRAALDYIVGSVHEIQDSATGRRYVIDALKSDLVRCKNEMFGGDGAAMTRRFYALTAENALRCRPQIIGHFDLIVKNNALGDVFSEDSQAYRMAALEALHACAETDAVFEVNTGGMYRGYRNAPYPARFLLEELRTLGVPITLNADAHDTAGLTYAFAETRDFLRDVGFRSVVSLRNGRWVEEGL
jgi:histidinol-phosphatase (PHP family)